MNANAFKQGFLEKCAALGLTPEETQALLEKSAFDFQKSWGDLSSAFNQGKNINWQALSQNPLTHTAVGAGLGTVGGGLLGGAGGAIGGGLLGAGAGALGSDVLGASSGPSKGLRSLFSGDNKKPAVAPKIRAPGLPGKPGFVNKLIESPATWNTIPATISRSAAGVQAARAAASGGRLVAARTAFSASPVSKVLMPISFAMTGAGGYEGFTNPEEMVDQAGVDSALLGGLDPYHGGKNIGAAANLALTGDTWRGANTLLNPFAAGTLDAANYKAKDLADFVSRNPGIDLGQVKSYFARHGRLPGG